MFNHNELFSCPFETYFGHIFMVDNLVVLQRYDITASLPYLDIGFIKDYGSIFHPEGWAFFRPAFSPVIEPSS